MEESLREEISNEFRRNAFILKDERTENAL